MISKQPLVLPLQTIVWQTLGWAWWRRTVVEYTRMLDSLGMVVQTCSPSTEIGWGRRIDMATVGYIMSSWAQCRWLHCRQGYEGLVAGSHIQKVRLLFFTKTHPIIKPSWSQVGWLVSVILALGKERQADQGLKVILSYMKWQIWGWSWLQEILSQEKQKLWLSVSSCLSVFLPSVHPSITHPSVYIFIYHLSHICICTYSCTYSCTDTDAFFFPLKHSSAPGLKSKQAPLYDLKGSKQAVIGTERC